MTAIQSRSISRGRRIKTSTSQGVHPSELGDGNFPGILSSGRCGEEGIVKQVTNGLAVPSFYFVNDSQHQQQQS